MEEVSENKLLGKQVTWEKIKGKANASMLETKGFGVLNKLILDNSMVIWGDYGVITSAVCFIDEVEDGYSIITNNSTYLIKEYK